MRNKSRKRILHEQRVEIAKLRRMVMNPPNTVNTRNRFKLIEKDLYDIIKKAHFEWLQYIELKMKMYGEVACTVEEPFVLMAQRIVQNGYRRYISIEDGYKLLEPCDETIYGGPHRGGRNFVEKCLKDYEIQSKILDQAIAELKIPTLSLQEDFNNEQRETD